MSTFRTRWLAVGLLLVLVAAWRSEGFLNADEHFQVLEFAGSKLGRTPVSALTWEYRERMRPWLQPGLYTVGAKGLSALGVNDPFEWAFAFRLFSGLTAWLGVVALSRCADRWFADSSARRFAVQALVLLYFAPFLAVRTSSESLSTSCFVLALCLVVLKGDRAGPGTALLTGVLLGLSTCLRYASGVMVASLLTWMVVEGRTPARRLAWVGGGIGLALAVAAAVDSWGYDAWTLAPWNYVAQNFGAGRAAREFGAEPWYGYLPILARGPFGPLNLTLAASAVVAWVRHPRHVLTWATAPLAIVLCAIAHKELRFLFPIAMLSAPLLVLAIGPLPRRAWGRAVAVALLAYDLVGLSGLCLLPARSVVPFQRFVSQRFPHGLEAFVVPSRSPWAVEQNTMFFYVAPPAGLRRWPGVSTLLAERTAQFDLLTSAWDPLRLVAPYVCRPLYRSVPEWISSRGWPAKGGKAPVAWSLDHCALPVPGAPAATGGDGVGVRLNSSHQ